MKTPDVIFPGADNGEGMIVHHKTAKGTDIYGLATPNIYVDTEWDLGPTWCYLIMCKKTTIIDTGRFENFDVVKNMLRSIDKDLSIIKRVIITHGHEDHDGNLAEIIASTGAELWAHALYPQMISYYPHIEDGARHPELPGSCRLCPMPEKFYRQCLPYHQKRSLLNLDFPIEDNQTLPEDGFRFIFTPGHTADSISIIFEDEVLFTGDTLLPDITPHPTVSFAFEANRRILPEEYRQENMVYGLMNYIKSLNKIAGLSSQPLPVTFPAHRMYYNGRFNIIHSSVDRARGVIQFHIDRCRDIMRILKDKPATMEEITAQHFPPVLLKGAGKSMGKNEIMAHVEIMRDCGDITWAGGDEDLVERTGSDSYLDVIGAYLN